MKDTSVRSQPQFQALSPLISSILMTFTSTLFQKLNLMAGPGALPTIQNFSAYELLSVKIPFTVDNSPFLRLYCSFIPNFLSTPSHQPPPQALGSFNRVPTPSLLSILIISSQHIYVVKYLPRFPVTSLAADSSKVVSTTSLYLLAINSLLNQSNLASAATTLSKLHLLRLSMLFILPSPRNPF